MAIAINHAFTNPKADGADTTIVRPSDWNAALVWSGLGTNQGLYSTGAGTLAQTTNWTYDGVSMTLAAGTITTDIAPLRLTETRNASGTTFKGLTYTITDTASAAGSLAMQILGGAAGTTNLISVSKTGVIRVPGLGTMSAAGNIRGDDNDLNGLGMGSGNLSFGNSFFLVQSQSNWRVASTLAFGFSTDIYNSAPDVAISRISAGLLGVGTGAAASTAGSLSMNNCTAVSYTVGTTAGLASFNGAVTNITVINGIVTAAS